MDDAVGELARVRSAFDQPTLTLLSRGNPRVTVTVFRCCFSRDVTTIATARMHQLVDTILGDLRATGASDIPTRSGRDLCQDWVRGLWLTRRPDEDDNEVYTLTSFAQDALSLVDSLTRERSTLSEHRIATIVETVRRLNAETNPSRSERVRLLEVEIARHSAERDRLLAGGEVTPIGPDRMLEAYAEILALVEALPSDFARVQEAFATLRRQILEDFRAEDRAAGAVIDTYLDRAENLMSATPEGRAFEGAFALLRNDALLADLREDLDALLGHPMATDILTDTDRGELRSMLAFINRGINDVLTQRVRVTRAIKDYIQTHDSARDRELDAVLRDLDGELGPWLARTGPRTRVPLRLLPEPHELASLPRSFHDPQQAAPPPPLEVDDETDDDVPSLADMLAWGGPSLAALADALQASGTDPRVATLGDLFADLPEDLRRPVEVFGLLHLAALAGHEPDPHDTETYPTVRPDGTTRLLDVPRTPIGAATPEDPDEH